MTVCVPFSSVVRIPVSSSVVERRLQYPSELFPQGSFQFEDGWIRGPEGELYVWIPPAHRLGLLNPRSILVIGALNTELDFRNFKCGEEWADIGSQNNI